MPKPKLALLAVVLTGFLAFPAIAAADCTLPTTGNGGTGGTVNDQYLNPADSVTVRGNFGPDLNKKFVQIPFEVVPANATGIRVRYCYAKVDPGAENPTLDLGIYEPNSTDPGNFTVAQSRGWSGSAVRIVGIGANGTTDPGTYGTGSARKAYVPGRTTRAYEPGPIPAGQWAVELGGGFIDPDSPQGVDWKVEFTYSTDPGWADDADESDPYQPNVANPNPGWYHGDLHVHGEQEPGNALSADTLDLAFGDPPSGSGLDFVTLVDHNNAIARRTLGALQGEHPGKVVIPGTEMTTYDGHFNAQGNSPLVDFRLGEIKKLNDLNGNDTLDAGELEDVRGVEDPADRFGQIQAGGGWAQINHPTIFKDNPAVCRGCFWNFSDQRTDFSKVNAIEIQTGPAGIPAGSPTPGMNPFTGPAIEYYEHALSTGAHIAAVGSSDDHQSGGSTGPFDSSVGHGATVVHAGQLSQGAIIAAVKAGHTYVKPFGPDAPDVTMKAGEPGKGALSAIPGDSVTAANMNIQINVNGAGASSPRPGPYTLTILRNGEPVSSSDISGDSFDMNFQATESGRYGFELTRVQGANTMIEAYSTPVWFTKKDPVTPPPPPPSNRFGFAGVKLNKKKGTAVLRVKVASPGIVRLAGRNLARSKAKASRADQVIRLNVRATGKLRKALRKRGRAIARTRVTFEPTGGEAAVKSKSVKLALKKKKKKRARR